MSRIPEERLKKQFWFRVSSGSGVLLVVIMRSILFALAIVGLLHAQSAKAPAPVMEAFQKAYPQAKLKSVKQEKRNGKRDKGELIEAEESMPVADLPAEVSAAVQAKHPKAKVVSAEKVTSPSGIKFEMIIQEGKKKKEVTLDSTGRFL